MQAPAQFGSALEPTPRAPRRTERLTQAQALLLTEEARVLRLAHISGLLPFSARIELPARAQLPGACADYRRALRHYIRLLKEEGAHAV